VLGAIVFATVGFSLVWMVGLGRRGLDAGDGPPSAAVAAPPETMPPDRFPGAAAKPAASPIPRFKDPSAAVRQASASDEGSPPAGTSVPAAAADSAVGPRYSAFSGGPPGPAPEAKAKPATPPAPVAKPAKPAATPDKPAATPDKPQPAAAAKPDAKPDPKPEPKPDPKPDPKPEPKPAAPGTPPAKPPAATPATPPATPAAPPAKPAVPATPPATPVTPPAAAQATPAAKPATPPAAKPATPPAAPVTPPAAAQAKPPAAQPPAKPTAAKPPAAQPPQGLATPESIEQLVAEPKSPKPSRPPATATPAASTAAAALPPPAGAFADDPDAPISVTPPSGPPATPANQLRTTPPSPRYASAGAVRAFGGSLPTPPPPGAPAVRPDAGPRGEGFGMQGMGEPGPESLEGVQAASLAIEKRGPREVQVGTYARYEILLRNVGTVTARDVVLEDMVPKGTSLVSTTPPAAPGAEGELRWPIGTLDPGGQARVVIEVLPTDEGEVGSVASVSYRSEASVRSLATRPSLAIETSDPEPVRIGGEVEMSITVSNPGTGRATGVVLEGGLPEGLSHRAGRALEFDVGRLEPGESRTIDLLLATDGPGKHHLELAVRADGQLEAHRPVVVEVTAPRLELAAEIPSRRYLQRPATCRLSMSNPGTASARSVELAAQLPTGMKFVRANNAGYYDEKTHRVLWHLEELPAAETGSVEMVLMPVALGTQEILLAARSTDNLSSQVSHTVDVEGVAALSCSVIDSEDPIEVDGVTEYVVRVGNQGTKPADNVRVTATLLGDMEPVEASGPVDHRIDNLTISFEPLARLAPTEESVFRIRARGRRAGDQRVQVQVSSAGQSTPMTKEEITRVYSDR